MLLLLVLQVRRLFNIPYDAMYAGWATCQHIEWIQWLAATSTIPYTTCTADNLTNFKIEI